MGLRPFERRYTDETKAAMLALADAGQTGQQIADLAAAGKLPTMEGQPFAVSRQAVNAVVRELRIARDDRKPHVPLHDRLDYAGQLLDRLAQLVDRDLRKLERRTSKPATEREILAITRALDRIVALGKQLGPGAGKPVEPAPDTPDSQQPDGGLSEWERSALVAAERRAGQPPGSEAGPPDPPRGESGSSAAFGAGQQGAERDSEEAWEQSTPDRQSSAHPLSPQPSVAL